MARGSKRTDLTLAAALGSFLERTLLPDLRARVAESPAVQRALADALARERAAGRTADDAIAYRERTLEQVGAAWLLGCVFVRYLEDRGLVASRRLAGDGAVDAQERFGAAFPGLAGNAREYLLAVFREAGNLPGARELLGARHDVARRLAPSAAVAADLLRLFREQLPDGSLRWRFDRDDTRVLGDLYQDLSAAVRERYALLQTPDFVESFILDRTLDPALTDFGLDGLRLIDPTCGSGHFLLGAFARLVEAHRRAAPAADPRDHAHAALQHLHGVDLNPFAVAITRFRLLVAYARAAGLERLRDAPADLALDQRVVVADSLLYGGKTLTLASASRDNTQRQLLGGDAFVLEDVGAAAKAFGQRYQAVVGNPPYITCKDSALRERYRAQYPDSASGKFALAAPFTERFFDLAVDGGRVGLINSNSFMKREFGKGLIEKVLRHLDLTEVVDTSMADIPGHDTPTVILFGRNAKPGSETVRVVMGRRGAAETPDDPAKGKVWSSIAAHDRELGFENEFITVAELLRATLAKHPWSLGGGGAGDLKALIEKQCETKLGELADDIGFASFTGLDDVFILPCGAFARVGVTSSVVRPIVVGESVRDWTTATPDEALVPYDASTQEPIALDRGSSWERSLWPFRATAEAVLSFGNKTRKQSGDNWWEWYRWQAARYRVALTITFAEVATHNHFVLDRGGKVFKQTAPIIKLPATATEDDHLALLAWLNSSVACFWMKQVAYPKATTTKDVNLDRGDPATNRFAFSGTALLPLPLPEVVLRDGPQRTAIVAATRVMESLAAMRAASEPAETVARWNPAGGSSLADALRTAKAEGDKAFRQMVVLQEELDWFFYRALQLADDGAMLRGEALVEERPYLWSGEQAPPTLHPDLRDAWERRREASSRSTALRTLEDPMFKRPWEGRRGVFGHGVMTWDERVLNACKDWLTDRVEEILRHNTTAESLRDIERALLGDPKARAVLDLLAPTLGDNTLALLSELAEQNSVPYLLVWRFTHAGLEKRALWEHTWAQQRLEDAGEAVGEIPVPPKYDREDYRQPRYWSLRGKLDVARERFIAYPGATTDDAPSPLYGWAGWDHRQRAEALTALYLRRRDDDGWGPERLHPLLAGLDELVPWLKQWHNTPEAGEDLGAGDAYEAFLATELHALGLTRPQLGEWRPPEKAAARAAAKVKAAATAAEGDAAAPPKKRGRPRKDAAG